MNLSYYPDIPFFDICPKMFYSTDTCSVMLIAIVFEIAKKWKYTKCPSSYKWVMKIWLIVEYYSVVNKKEIMKFSS